MMKMLLTCLAFVMAVAAAQAEPLRIELDSPNIEPLPFAAPAFIAESAGADQYARDLAAVVSSDLQGSGLFRAISQDAFISQITSFDSPVQYADWKAINAQALITGAVTTTGDGQIVVKFRLFDVFSEDQMGEGLQFVGSTNGWRRMAHKVADAVYSRITGEGGYFDSRVVYVSETGPKNARLKRLGIMDYDGANQQFLTDAQAIVLAPRFSPNGDRVIYTSYESGFPKIYVLDVASVGRRVLQDQPGTMSFAPRFAPNGQDVVFSLTTGSNTDIYKLNLDSGQRTQLTSSPAIETAPSYSPDGTQIVFESDRSGTQQLYVMNAGGGEATRISFGQGRYGTPVWSPRGDLIAFTKQNRGRFHIGVMRTDGSGERLLTASFLDEGPTWSPNGRVIMFTRETAGSGGSSTLYSVDISGRNLKAVQAQASDPSWSPLLK
ncbi:MULTISPECIES: Tol-Pal system beta propeller repeat protein TolB [Litoreibacter]|uniref:Tol-Pal system protein TolB n=1 Tax=Litoreibacter ascidiaceicola TaxID=1486859 RepID=A0A1M4Y6I8_9RHOB|nr:MULTISPECIES: Tol-Pal system beta propeller repeat protein TolB [Litoreibacter]SHF01424.1 TolB protein [Litoreibacter ascidiaceicola]